MGQGGPIGFRAFNDPEDDKIINNGRATVFENLFVQNIYDEPDGNITGQLSRGKVYIYEEGKTEDWVRCDYGWIRKEYLTR